MSSSTGPKQYTWNSELDARKEFHEAFAFLEQKLGSDKISHCFDPAETELVRPIPPVQHGNSPAAQAEYRKALREYESQTAQLHKDFMTAINSLKSLFTYGCSAYQHIEQAIKIIPQGMEPVQFTPELKFRAAILRLTRYSPADDAANAKIRKQIAVLRDDDEGFDTYVAKFTDLYTQLVKINKTPSDEDARQWVIDGVVNVQVKQKLSELFNNGLQLPTYLQMFNHIKSYLLFLGDHDPYKTVKASFDKTLTTKSPTSVAFLAKRSPTNGRSSGWQRPNNPSGHPLICTRCWRKGHSYIVCNETTCGECNLQMGSSKYCHNYSAHKTNGTNWIHPKFRGGTSPVNRNEPQADLADRITKRVLSAILKETKRAKPNN
jgi:hypothetical protein